MEKLLILLLFILTTDLHASGIASNTNSAPCTNNTLETYSGNSNLAADWQPNEIQLRWYSGNTLMDVQESANTCVYDGNLSIPSNAPTRTGYTFAGWTVRPEMDFSTITTDENGVFGGGNGDPWAGYYDDNGWHEGYLTNIMRPEFNDIDNQEWKIIFNHGTLYGMAKCSDKIGNNNNYGFDVDKSNYAATEQELNITTNAEKRYCWCKATGYKPVNQNVVYGPAKTLNFVFQARDEYVGHCKWICAPRCGLYIMHHSKFRTTLFTPAGN